MSAINDIQAAIIAKLNTLTGPGQKISEVLDCHTGNISGFPAASSELLSVKSDFLSNTDNLTEVVFDIVIHQEMQGITRPEAKEILNDVLDDVKNAFNGDYNLGGVVDYCNPLETDASEIPAEHGAMAYGYARLTCFFEEQVMP